MSGCLYLSLWGGLDFSSRGTFQVPLKVFYVGSCLLHRCECPVLVPPTPPSGMNCGVRGSCRLSLRFQAHDSEERGRYKLYLPVL